MLEGPLLENALSIIHFYKRTAIGAHQIAASDPFPWILDPPLDLALTDGSCNRLASVITYKYPTIWVEVKAGQPLKVQPEFGKLIHISQAALGEVKDVKGAKHVPLRLKVDSKNFIIGSLSAEDRAQLMFDLVFERDFELSHDWKNGSVYFMGYVADDPVSDGEEFSDDFEDESEDEPVDALENGNALLHYFSGYNPLRKPPQLSWEARKKISLMMMRMTGSDSDDEMALDGEDSSDVSGEEDEDDEDDSSEEELPKKSKKRAAEQETPVPAKKAKSSTPDKSGNKKGQAGTPFPSKPAGKTPTGNKSKEQTPKSGGQLSCKSCSKSFTSENALQSHAKAKHGGK
ncbi:Histone deacetylase HDT1 [Sesamum angolense]|uniref:Histone deacetylase HDT1 n=1 Tax=Sesamum angolense TaxID=2727404 RepID=A0AAE1XC64_9LAMI|nr:Histone deacetylase HDT1 [Sesamum angolense]